MAKMWKKLLKQCKGYHGNAIRILIMVNTALAVYTIPALLDNQVDDKSGLNNHSSERLNVNKRGTTDEKYIPENNRTSVKRDDSHDGGEKYQRGFYLNQPKDGCLEDAPFLLIAVCSAVNHFDLRHAIRQTWASVIHKYKISTKIVFVLGAPSTEFSQLQDHVTRESEAYDDVIQGDFEDSYVNLTIKTLSVLKWVLKNCDRVKFFMKTDDDVFVNVANLINVLMDTATSTSSASGHFMLGHVIRKAKPISDRNSKWFTPNVLFKGDAYPDYLSGSAYVVTGNVLERLYGAAISRTAFWLEDVYITGVLSRSLNIPLVHDDRFTYKKPKMFHPCVFRIIVAAHHISPVEMRTIWSQLHSVDPDCQGYLKDSSLKRYT